MIYFSRILLLALVFFISSCSVDEPTGLSDAEIVQMIIEAEKAEITIDELPENSQNSIYDDHTDYMGLYVKKATGLGYEVDLAGLGYRSGKRNEVYFNIDGRKLDPNDWGNEKRRYREDYSQTSREDWRCFELVFPISFDMPDGSVIEVSSDDENGWSQIKSWYDSNPGARQKPLMQFPVVIFFDEETITLYDRDDLRGAYAECNYDRPKDRHGYDRKEPCFELVYPVSFTMPDGSSMVVSSDDEDGWSEVKDWYNENSGFEEQKPLIEYPVSVIYKTESGDSTVTFSTEEEMVSAKEECVELWDDGYKRICFELVFPLDYLMPDGSTITVESDDMDGWSELKDWYSENLEVEEKPTLVFPINIAYETEGGDSLVVVGSEEELMMSKRACWEEEENDWDQDGEWDQDSDEECYSFVYPITFTMPDGSTMTLESEEGFREMESWYESNDSYEQEPTFQYPIEIVLRDENGVTTLTINNDEELEEAEENCDDEDGEWDQDSDEECYSFVYPITFTMPDGSTMTLESEEGFREMESWYESNDSYEQEPTFQYPIEIVLRDEDGVTTITINNDEELEEAEENCED